MLTPFQVTAANARFARIASDACARKAIQNVGELATLLERAAAVEPRTIVEVGCDAGGTLYAWRTAFPDAHIYGVTLRAGPYASGEALADHGATIIEGDSHDPKTANRFIAEVVSGAASVRPVDFLFIDGDHSYEGVQADWELWSPFVRSGGLVAFHDVRPHPAPQVGVHRFWRALDHPRKDVIAFPPVRHGYGIGLVEM